MSKKLLVILSAVCLMASVFVGCSKGENKTTNNEATSASTKQEETRVKYSGEKGRISVYLSGPANMVEELENAFEKDRGDVLELYHAGCGPLRQKIWTEVEAGNIHADVFFGSNPLIYHALKEKGALENYVSEHNEDLKEEYKVGDGFFTLVNARYEVLVYDKGNISKEDAPKSYEDLKDSKWKDKIAYTDISQSSTALALTTGLWDMKGQNMSYFEGLKANNTLVVAKSKEVADKIQSGEIGAGITAYDAVASINKKAKKEGFESNLGMIWPKEGAIRLERPIAIMKNDTRPEENTKLAKEFVDFMLSPEGQKITVKYNFFSIRNDVEVPKGAPSDIKYKTIDWDSVSKHEKTIRDDFKKVMLGN